MPLTPEQRRLYASAPAEQVEQETLTLTHPGFSKVYHITSYPKAFEGLVSGVPVTFEPVPFAITLPADDGRGQQDMRLTIGNVARVMVHELEAAARRPDPTPILMDYRMYIKDISVPDSGLPPSPMPDPPLRLHFSQIEMTATGISGTATRADIINRRFPWRVYTLHRFPGLDR